MWWHWLEFLHRWSVDHHKNTVSWSVCFWMAMLYDASQQPSYRQQFVSLGDYVAVDGTELSLKEGEVLEILRVGNNGWWYAHSLTTETEGWVPSTYLDPVPTQHLSTHSSSGNDKVWLSLVLAVATSPWPAQQYSVTWLSMLYLKLVKTSCKSVFFGNVWCSVWSHPTTSSLSECFYSLLQSLSSHIVNLSSLPLVCFAHVYTSICERECERK